MKKAWVSYRGKDARLDAPVKDRSEGVREGGLTSSDALLPRASAVTGHTKGFEIHGVVTARPLRSEAVDVVNLEAIATPAHVAERHRFEEPAPRAFPLGVISRLP